ncbi:hypothetical protein CYMTET_28119 [Cymbomonas tetramitiformis]|nr:hypothetical protein CYMTET_28119 [Cymbomonas tetramitiformis]
MEELREARRNAEQRLVQQQEAHTEQVAKLMDAINDLMQSNTQTSGTRITGAMPLKGEKPVKVAWHTADESDESSEGSPVTPKNHKRISPPGTYSKNLANRGATASNRKEPTQRRGFFSFEGKGAAGSIVKGQNGRILPHFGYAAEFCRIL